MTHPVQEPDPSSEDRASETDESGEPIEEQAASRDNVADEGLPTDPEHPTG